MTKRRDFKLVLSDNGSYIGARKGCIYIRARDDYLPLLLM